MTADSILVVAALISHQGRLLICQRRADDALGLKWEFPGGKVKPGETPEAALVRELREELDAEATIRREIYSTSFAYSIQARIIQLHFFEATVVAPEAIQNLAFEKIQWAEPPDLMNLDFLPADRELVRMIASRELKMEPAV